MVKVGGKSNNETNRSLMIAICILLLIILILLMTIIILIDKNENQSKINENLAYHLSLFKSNFNTCVDYLDNTIIDEK